MNASRGPQHWLKRVTLGPDWRKTLLRATVAGILTVLVLKFVVLPVRLRGISMEPTYSDGALHLANLLAYRWREPRQGDVVLIEMTGRKALYLKRVIGTPGDLVAFVDGRCFVNGAVRPEAYVSQTNASWTIPEVRVGTDEYYVAGDNRSVPWEMHTLGVVKRDKIVGSILF